MTPLPTENLFDTPSCSLQKWFNSLTVDYSTDKLAPLLGLVNSNPNVGLRRPNPYVPDESQSRLYVSRHATSLYPALVQFVKKAAEVVLSEGPRLAVSAGPRAKGWGSWGCESNRTQSVPCGCAWGAP